MLLQRYSTRWRHGTTFTALQANTPGSLGSPGSSCTRRTGLHSVRAKESLKLHGFPPSPSSRSSSKVWWEGGGGTGTMTVAMPGHVSSKVHQAPTVVKALWQVLSSFRTERGLQGNPPLPLCFSRMEGGQGRVTPVC